MDASSLEWSDLRVVLAICRAGSLVGAGRLLSCSHTTVFRRINAIEERAEVRFFERLPSGYAMTDAGEVAKRFGERVEAEFLALSREVLGRDTEVSGNVVITAPEGIVSHILPPILLDFRREHPDVTFEVVESNAAFDLARREADIAIRATRKPPDDSLGRRISTFRFAVYGNEDLLAATADAPLSEQPWVGLQGTIAWLVPQVFKSTTKAEERMVYTTNAAAAAIEAVRAGVGVTLMPCYRCDPIGDLHRLAPPLPHLTMELWVLTHPALRHTARVKVLMRHLTEALRARAPLFDGTGVTE
jgi:DNA-binding transcriptional LysR family regulator